MQVYDETHDRHALAAPEGRRGAYREALRGGRRHHGPCGDGRPRASAAGRRGQRRGRAGTGPARRIDVIARFLRWLRPDRRGSARPAKMEVAVAIGVDPAITTPQSSPRRP